MAIGAHRNDPCWCGSGKKLKKCHLNRHNEPALPPQAVVREARDASEWRTCLHPLAGPGTCSKIGHAHTIQRARTLRQLVDASNHVLTFFPYQPEADGLTPTLHRRGWQKASTFTGFCSRHDDATFAAAEKAADAVTREGAFALSYRALCHELFQKITAQRAEARLRSLVDRGLPPHAQQAIQQTYAVRAAGREKAITQLRELKARADRELLATDYDGWHFVVVSFEGALCLATAGTPTPTLDLDLKPLQVLHDPKAELEHLHLSIVSYREKQVDVVFGWRVEHAAPEALVGSLLSRPNDLIGSYIAQYVFAHLENVYFSSSWWSGLSSSDQEYVRELTVNVHPYYDPPTYRTSPLVPWALRDVVAFGGRNA
jgi:hypothetical protein